MILLSRKCYDGGGFFKIEEKIAPVHCEGALDNPSYQLSNRCQIQCSKTELCLKLHPPDRLSCLLYKRTHCFKTVKDLVD